MANAPRIKKAAPGTYAGRQYLSMDEAEHYLGIKRSTLQTRISRIGIQPQKFADDRRHYLKMEDVQAIEAVIKESWRLEEYQARYQEKERDGRETRIS